jgi:hypothetical protein
MSPDAAHDPRIRGPVPALLLLETGCYWGYSAGAGAGAAVVAAGC